MTWTRRSRRPTACARLRPALEGMEARTLLSNVPSLGSPIPAGDNSSSLVAPFENLIGAVATRDAYKVDGTGMTAAVIDTGVNYDHEALGGGFGPGFKVEAGVDLGNFRATPLATWQHGTAVTGLLASADPAHQGIAPGADIVALRVFSDDNSSGFDRVADALQWVLDNYTTYNISVVNLSISDGGNYTLNWYAFDGGIGKRINDLVKRLDALDIPVVTAAGNSFNGAQGMGYTAIVKDTISVTGSDATDRLVGNAQRLGSAVGGDYATDLVAPGTGLVAPAEGNSFVTVEGTSYAAPIVSGAVLLLQQIYRTRFGTLPSVDQVEGWLKDGSDPILDSATGVTFRRLDIAKAASLIPPAPNTGGSGDGGSGPGTGGETGNPGTGGSDGGTTTPGGDPSPPPPQTTIILNGQTQGTVPSGSDANPFKDAGSLFGIDINVDTSRSWTASHTPNQMVQTNLFVNGMNLGTVPSTSAKNPLADFAALFDIDGAVTTSQTWTASNIPSETKTALYVDGKFRGYVDTNSAANPLAGFTSEFGIEGSFSQVQSWTSSARSPKPAGTLGRTVRFGRGGTPKAPGGAFARRRHSG